jgi:glycine cleavage system aminomethyltransferase T
MGFGSYDESEQRDETPNTDDEGAETVSRTGFDGELGYESGADTDDLLDKLGEIKAADEGDEA